MRDRRCLVLLVVYLLVVGTPPSSAPRAAEMAPGVQALDPTPKWQYKGCTSWCQFGWYASPAVADLDADGTPEVIWSPYSIYVVDGATGNLRWSVRSGRDRSNTSGGDVGRTWPGIVVADLDNDGQPEIVTAHGAGWVSAYNKDGYFKPGWPRQPYPSEIRSLAVADLDRDRKLEVIVARASGGSYGQWTVLQTDGTVRPGWPKLTSGEPGYGWGAYNQNIAVADIDADGKDEIIGPSDVHYISAFEDDGRQIGTNARYNNYNPRGPKVWSQVGVHVEDAIDLRGYADCGVNHRPNFANSAPVIGDIDGNGTLEIAVVGNVYDCAVGNDESGDLAYMPFIFNKDRSRWANGTYDWTVIPPLGGPSGRPLSENYSIIQNAVPNAVLADLDGDGVKELLYPSYDGKLHAYWMDKSQHGSWPFNVTQLVGDLSFASEPVVIDLDNDGKSEVIFGTWPRNGERRVGRMVVTDWQGNLIQQLPLPNPLSTEADAWNGVLAAPTIANLDSDPDLELVVGTVGSGLVAYDLPNTAAARIGWGTGRGSFLRNGAPSAIPLQARLAIIGGANLRPGDTVTVRLILANPSNAPLAALQLNSTLPGALLFVVGSLTASRGTAQVNGQTITWSGTVPAGTPVTIAFQARVDPALTGTTAIPCTFQISGGQTLSLETLLVVNSNSIRMPLLQR